MPLHALQESRTVWLRYLGGFLTLIDVDPRRCLGRLGCEHVPMPHLPEPLTSRPKRRIARRVQWHDQDSSVERAASNPPLTRIPTSLLTTSPLSTRRSHRMCAVSSSGTSGSASHRRVHRKDDHCYTEASPCSLSQAELLYRGVAGRARSPTAWPQRSSCGHPYLPAASPLLRESTP